MKALIKSLSLGAVFALGGCAVFSHTDPFMEVTPGMEEAQVQSLLGTPIDRKFVANHDEWTYRKDMGHGVQKTKVIVFENQKVIALADDAVAAEREFELARARAGAPEYPVLPNGQNANGKQTTTATPPLPQLNAGSPMVLPATPDTNNAAVAGQPLTNPSAGTSSGVAPQPPAPPAQAPAAAPAPVAPPPVAPPAPQAEVKPAVPPSTDLAPADDDKPKKVVQKKAKKQKHAKHHHPITEPKGAEENAR